MIPNLNHKPNVKLSIDKILFIIACSYLALVIFWVVSQGKLKLPGMTNSSEQVTEQTTNQKPTLSPKDAQFIAYLQQSLEILERKQQQQKANPTPAQTLKVPPPPLPSNPPSTTPTAPQVIERIYVPVYPQIQQPTVAVNPPPKNNKTPPVIAVKPASPPRLNVPSPPPLPAPPQPLKAPSTVPVLTPGTTLLPEVAASTSSTSSNNSLSPLLVGLLEAGEQSSALFTIDGQTRRVQLGEAIGATGWMLQSVQNQQVIITRNGKARSLEVGQNF